MNKNWEKWFRALLRDAGYQEGDKLVVGVSGGPDSVALLHLLRGILAPSVLHVVHLDHGIRPSAPAEAKYVSELAAAWDIPFSTQQVDVPEIAKREGWSLEEAARNARYQFMAQVAQEAGARLVAVGHNSNDQAETILLHFLRGSGLRGLRGMLPLSPFPGDPSLSLIRPLLNQSRADIETYCQEHNLNPLQDESNQDPAYLRNRIRLQLLPELAAYNPQIKNHLLQLAAIAEAEDDLVSMLFDDAWPELVVQTGPGWLTLDRDHFCDLSIALQRRAIRQAVETLHSDLTDLAFKTVEQAVELANRPESGTEMLLPGGLTLLVDYKTFLFMQGSAEIPLNMPQLQQEEIASEALRLSIPGQVELADGWVIAADWVEGEVGNRYSKIAPWTAVIDLPQSTALFVRPRKLGERMQPLGMDGRSSSLQDIMVNRKIAKRLREKWPLVATDEHVVWLTGHIIDHRAQISDNPRRIVRLTCERLGDKS
ncbi:MAG: tRNA lysidine(34) synthetase TilS [Candidatus Promineifilaceae bacterium]|jgi:tRNA(Ile)-lysidine synthase